MHVMELSKSFFKGKNKQKKIPALSKAEDSCTSVGRHSQRVILILYQSVLRLSVVFEQAERRKAACSHLNLLERFYLLHRAFLVFLLQLKQSSWFQGIGRSPQYCQSLKLPAVFWSKAKTVLLLKNFRNLTEISCCLFMTFFPADCFWSCIFVM